MCIVENMFFFFCGGRGSNPRPYIFNALSIPIELSSRRQLKTCLTLKQQGVFWK